MAKVNFVINGRKYALGCDAGEEERLMRLGQKLDDRVNTMANQFGQIGCAKKRQRQRASPIKWKPKRRIVCLMRL